MNDNIEDYIMSDNIKSFGRETDNGKLMTPEETLDDVRDTIGKNGALKNGKKMIVLCLDDTDNNFRLTWFQCGMTMSQCVSLCECAKSKFLKEMDY